MLTLARPPGDVIVRAIPEHRADDELSRAYRDLKITLGVPWVGVITQALAYYRPLFFEDLVELVVGSRVAKLRNGPPEDLLGLFHSRPGQTHRLDEGGQLAVVG